MKTAPVGKWTVRHGNLYIDYAFANDGNYKFLRHGDGFFEEETGRYDVEGDRLTLMPSGGPQKDFRWSYGRDPVLGQIVLWLADSFGQEMLYSDPAIY